MVFLIQNTQNRDAKAVHLKLDEIIRALKGARNELVDLEELSDEDLKKLEEQFPLLRQKLRTTESIVAMLHRTTRIGLNQAGLRASPVRRKILPLGQSRKTSQFAQSGLRAKQRRRPCQMSQ